MIAFIYSIPNLILYSLFLVFAFIFSIIVLLVIQYFIPINLRNKGNEVTVGTSAAISVIYAVLIGIAALYELDNFSSAEVIVQKEANAVGDLYRDTSWLEDPTRTIIRNNIKIYLAEVINQEWPDILKRHNLNPHGNILLNQITDELYAYRVNHPSASLTLHDILKEVKGIYNYREDRMSFAGSALGPDMWLVIVLSALVTIGINALYGIEFRLHLISIIAISFVVASMVFLVAALDNPFLGAISLKPDPYLFELAHINQDYREFSR